MELILINDVPNLGFKDDIVSVKNGYGRNFLIPQGLAILATDSAKKILNENIKQREFKEKKVIEDANFFGVWIFFEIFNDLAEIEIVYLEN